MRLSFAPPDPPPLVGTPRLVRFACRALAFLALGGALVVPPSGPLAAHDGPLRASSPADSLRALETFDEAWARIADTYYDPDFAGLDWEAVRDELRPRAASATSVEELRSVIHEMLGRLGESHFVLIPSDATADAPGGLARGTASTGIELRWTGGRALITRVDASSPADRAGIRPGYELVAIAQRPVQGLAEEIREAGVARASGPLPPYWVTAGLAARLQGPPASELELTVRGGDGEERTVPVAMEEPPGQVVRFGNLPPFRLHVEDHTEVLANGRRVGVLRFSGWFPAAAPLVADAVDRFRELDGIVIDLRGNPGGVGGMAMGIGGHFLDERVELGTMRTRETTLRFVVNPQRIAPDGRRVDPYAGPVAILVDGLSGSTSEIFAAGLQALGRARVFGEPTAGEALPALVVELPNGDRLMHAIADFTAPDGTRLEGRGVQPDGTVAPDRATLLAGEDPVLRRALEWLSRAPAFSQETRP